MQTPRGTSSNAKASLKASPTFIAWAAGFLEGEAHFNPKTKGIIVGQVNPEPLFALQHGFGGSVGYVDRTGKGQQSWYRWTVCGARSFGVMLTIYQFLSRARKTQVAQIINGMRNCALSNPNPVPYGTP